MTKHGLDQQQIAKRLKEIRLSKDMTQAELAAACGGEARGISQVTICRYESLQRVIPADVLPLVARALSVSLDEFYKLPGTPVADAPQSRLEQYVRSGRFHESVESIRRAAMHWINSSYYERP